MAPTKTTGSIPSNITAVHVTNVVAIAIFFVIFFSPKGNFTANNLSRVIKRMKFTDAVDNWHYSVDW
jgi:hypothetical protein